MNKQRKVLITTTYNEMGIIIDTKAEEVTQPEKRTNERTETHACDCISRQAAIKILHEALDAADQIAEVPFGVYQNYRDKMNELPSAQPDVPDINVGDMISRQAALDIFDDYNVAVENGQIEAYSRDRKRLCDLPPAQPAPCEDAVSRKAVAGIYTALWETIGTIMDRDEWDDVCKATANELPPAQPKRGKWGMGIDERFVECSECGLMTTRNELRGLAVFGKNEPNFCPNCGADMREVTK